ncbi:MAG: tetratricopeptide repeat protein [Planctomycetota bacterium]
MTDETALSISDQIDIVCDEFERAWTAGERKSIEEFLSLQFSEPHRKKLLRELILLELDLQQQSREPVSAESALRKRFPDDAEIVSDIFRMTETIIPAQQTQDGSLHKNHEQTFVHDQCASNGSQNDRDSSRRSRFSILRLHARGGLGEVFVARDTELNREVALKEIQPHFADHLDSRSRFVLEAEVTGGLEHPGIVPVYGLGQYEDGRPYYAMRFIKGDSLKEAIEAFHGKAESGERTADQYNGLAFRKLLGRFIDVCQAISYAHSRGVLHRDLKPGNIMLGKYGETLVVDWGLAKVADRSDAMAATNEGTLQPASGSGVTPTMMGSAIGTPAYMPPEQAAGRIDELGPASDVYSLGATLYHLLVGHAPFRGTETRKLLDDVQAGRYQAPQKVQPAVPRSLDAVCLKAMSPKPGDRYPSPLDLADDIERFLADEPVTAFIEPFSVRARRWVRKHQTLTVTTAAVVLVSTVGLGGFSTIVSGKNAELNIANTNERNARTAAETAQKLAETNEQAAREQSQLALSTLTSVVNDIQRGLSSIPGSSEVRRRMLTTSLEKLDSVSTTFLSQTSVDGSTWQALIETGDLIFRFSSSADAGIPAGQAATSVDEVTSEPLTARWNSSTTLEPQHITAYCRNHSNGRTYTYMQTGGPSPSLTVSRPGIVIHESRYTGECRHGDTRYFQYVVTYSADSSPAWVHTATQLGQYEIWFPETGNGEVLYTKDKGQRFLSQQEVPPAGDVVTNESYDQITAVQLADKYFQRAFQIAKQLAEADPQNAQWQRQLFVTHERLSIVLRKLNRFEDALRQMESALQITRMLVASNPGNADNLLDLSLSLERLGVISLNLGRVKEALEFQEEALQIRRTVAESDPKHLQKQLALLVSCNKVGDIMLATGRTDAAAVLYQDGMTISKMLVEADPDNTQHHRELAYSFTNLGEVSLRLGKNDEALRHFQDGLQIRRALAEADVSDSFKQHDLSSSLERTGDTLLQLGRPDDALAHYEECVRLLGTLTNADLNAAELRVSLSLVSVKNGAVLLKLGRIEEAITQHQNALKIRRDLAKVDPTNLQKQRGVASLSDHFGNVLYDLGRPEHAIAEYLECLKLRRAIAEANPRDSGIESDLLYSLNRLGDVYLALKRPDQALGLYEDALKIRRTTAEADADNAIVQVDLANLLNHLGDVFMQVGRTEEAITQFQDRVKIHRVLAEADPGDAQKQRNLLVSMNKLGDMFLRIGRTDEALRVYQDGMTISRSLIEADPNHTQNQRELAFSFNNLGEVFLALGRTDEALTQFQHGLKTRRALAAVDPDNSLWQKDVVVSLHRIGQVYMVRDEFTMARESHDACAAILRSMIDRGMTVNQSKQDLALAESSSQAARMSETSLGEWEALLAQPLATLPALLEMRGIHLTKRSRFPEAAQAAAKLKELDHATNVQLYNAACMFSLSAASVKAEEGKELTAEQTAQRNEWINAALATLKQSINKGWSDFAHMQQDSDLAPLRDFPEFKAMIPASAPPERQK